MHHYFPQEIWSHILIYLPVISLCRFNLVSRSFHAIINSPDFIYTEMITSLNKKNNIVLECSSSNNNNHGNRNLENLAILVRRCIGHDQDDYTLIEGGPNLSDPSRLFLTEIVFPHGSKRGDDKIVGSGYGLMGLVSSLVGIVGKIILSDESRLFLRELFAGHDLFAGDYKIGGSSYGLICLLSRLGDGVGKNHKIILWNPSIRKSVTLLEPLISHEYDHVIVVGCGVDYVSSDFKVVRIVFGGGRYSRRFEPNRAEVYSLTRNTWTGLVDPNIPCNEYVLWTEPVVLNGCPHWLAVRSPEHLTFILTFDMSTEEFSKIMAPVELGIWNKVQLCYNLSRETPTIVEYIDIGPSNRSSCNIWVMMEYGVVESWNKMCSFDLVSGLGEVIGFKEERCEVLVSRTCKELIVYEIETGVIKELGIFGSESSFFVNRYMESLLLLKNNLLG